MNSGSIFNFSQDEILTFFAVLMRYSVLIAVLPLVGDRFVPATAKVLLSLAITFALFPALVARGEINPAAASVWGATTGGIATTVGLEALFGMVLGFTGKLVFESVAFGGHLVGNFMGFSAATTYDPHQEAQTLVISELQMAIAMLMFLALDGHHLMLRASLDSYRVLGLGGAGAIIPAGSGPFINGAFSQRLIEITGQVIRFGIQLAAPVAVSMFAVNVVFAVMSKAMPQLNVLVLSFAVTALVGLLVLLISIPEFTGMTSVIFGKMQDWMQGMLMAMARGK
jgi:flagellar biosynthetic protein FliR